MNTKEIKTEFNNFLKTEEGRSWQKEKACVFQLPIGY